MRSQHQASVSIPIPANIPAQIVVAFVQTYVPTLRHNPCIVNFEEIVTEPDSISNDPFFGPIDGTVRTYQVYEVTQLVPGISAQANWPFVFQHTPEGIRGRAMNERIGTNVWVRWTVRPRHDVTSPAHSESTSSSTTEVGEEWELCDDITIECNRLMMPFTAPYARKMHEEITRKIVEEVVKKYFNGTMGQ